MFMLNSTLEVVEFRNILCPGIHMSSTWANSTKTKSEFHKALWVLEFSLGYVKKCKFKFHNMWICQSCPKQLGDTKRVGCGYPSLVPSSWATQKHCDNITRVKCLKNISKDK